MRPSERLSIAMLLLLCGVTAVSRPAGGVLRLWIFLALAVAVVILARAGEKSSRAGVLRDWWGVVVVAAIFLLLQPIIEAATPWRLDAALAAFDARVLAGLAEAWRGAFGRPDLFTDVVYGGYLFHYLLPVAVAAMARRRLGPDGFEPVVFGLLLAFYVCYLCYLLLPASGPRLPLEDEANLLGGGQFSGAVRAFLHGAEATTLDAFPSGHTAVPIVAAVYGCRVLGRAGATLVWICALAVVFATVYIHVHYVADVLAGVLLALLVLPGAPVLARMLGAPRPAAGARSGLPGGRQG
jgi:membrane-associated phospholipid phosphatase